MNHRLGFLLALLAACTPTHPPPAPVHFADGAAQSGIDFVHFNGFSGEYYYVETFGGGAAFFDWDGDEWLDLYLVNGTDLSGLAPDPPPVNRLYRNRGDGTFAPVEDGGGAADKGYGHGVAAGDYDGDGDQDLYVTNFGANTLYRNDGGHFSDLTQQTHSGDRRWGTSAGFFDSDNDGDLDLYVTNYVDFGLDNNKVCKKGTVRSYCEPSVYAPVADVLYRNDGDRFSDVTQQAGTQLLGRGLGVAFSDCDLDGDTDIYIANDGTMNFLYENQGGTFVEVGLKSGARYNQDGRAEAGMGVDFGDYDNDGDQDLFVTNFAFETNTLYANDGRGRYTDVSAGSGLGEATFMPLGFGTKFIDYDNDSYLDIFVGNGHVMDVVAAWDPTQTYRQANQMFRNRGGRRFEEVSAQLGADFANANVARGTAVADYDNDGDLDLLVTTVGAAPRLLRNDGGNRNHWLQILLVGHTHPDALGARVIVTAAGVRQTKERTSGGSYLSSHDPRLHFGLGAAASADVEIHWPDGLTQHIEAVAANQVLRLVQQLP